MHAGEALRTDAMRRPDATETALTHLETMIDLRRVLPGESLPSAAVLAKEIGVNRMAVLQALQVLKRDGLVTVRRGRGGARIVGWSSRPATQRLARAIAKREPLEQTALLREIVESGIARAAAERGLEPDRLALAEEILLEMRDVDDRDRYLALDTRFHEILGEATGSDLIRRLALGLRQAFLVGLDAVDVPADRLRTSTHEHERLLAAIRRRSPAVAAEWAHRHAAASRGLVSDALGISPALNGRA